MGEDFRKKQLKREAICSVVLDDSSRIAYR